MSGRNLAALFLFAVTGVVHPDECVNLQPTTEAYETALKAMSGQLRCWQFSQHEPGEPYNCGRKIISAHSQSGINLASEYEIPLSIIEEATFALAELLAEGDEIESMDYVPVHCGGTWSIDRHGYVLKLKSKKPVN